MIDIVVSTLKGLLLLSGVALILALVAITIYFLKGYGFLLVVGAAILVLSYFIGENL